MDKINFNNGEYVDLNKDSSEVIKQIIENHPKATPDIRYVRAIDFNIDALNYILKNGDKKDFNLFISTITENSRNLSFKDLDNLRKNIDESLKNKFYSVIENIVFYYPFKPESAHVHSEENFRHKIIFDMVNYLDNKSIADKWYDMEDFFAKTGHPFGKFSIKSIMFWRQKANQNTEFYNNILEYYPVLLAQSSKNMKHAALYSEDVLFSYYDFEDEVKTKKYLSDLNKLKDKEYVDKSDRRLSIGTSVKENLGLPEKNLIKLVLTYKEVMKKNNEDLGYKNIFRTALTFYLQNKSKNQNMDNMFFLNYFKHMKEDVKYIEESELKHFLSIWINNIENLQTIELIEKEIKDSERKLKLSDILDFEQYSFNCNLINKPSEDEIYNILNILKENGANLNKIFSPANINKQTDLNRYKDVIAYTEHYFPVFIDFFIKNNLTLSKKESSSILSYFDATSKLQEFRVNKLKPAIIKILKESNLSFKEMNYLYKKSPLKNIDFFKEILLFKEKELILNSSDVKKSLNKKKRL